MMWSHFPGNTPAKQIEKIYKYRDIWLHLLQTNKLHYLQSLQIAIDWQSKKIILVLSFTNTCGMFENTTTKMDLSPFLKNYKTQIKGSNLPTFSYLFSNRMIKFLQFTLKLDSISSDKTSLSNGISSRGYSSMLIKDTFHSWKQNSTLKYQNVP